MTEERKKFRVVEIDGEHYIRVLIYKDQSESQKKNYSPSKRVWLKDENGKKKSYRSYEIKGNRHSRKDAQIIKLISADVDEVYRQHGISVDGAEETKSEKESPKTKIADLHGLFLDHLETHTSKRTLQPREKDTINCYKKALQYYLKAFGNHPVSKFPPGVQEDFQTKLATYPSKTGSDRKMAAMTIRKHAIAMNTFFRFLSTRSLMHGPMIILELPSKSLKPEVRIRPDSSRMKMFDRLMQKVQEHQIEKSRKKYRMSEGQQYMNHLKAWWVMDTTGMRLAEVWILTLKSFKLMQREITVKNIDTDGGRDNHGKKFRIRFRLKGKNRTRKTVGIPEDLAAFLEMDLNNRGKKEKWYLDRGDGSNQYTLADSLGTAIQRHWKALGLSHEAKRCHGSRASVLTELTEENPWMAKQQAGHTQISTTIENYAGENLEKVKDLLNKTRSQYREKALEMARK